MKCPVDATTLLMSERQGVEIDYCPQCRGVWLDRGELDNLIRRADDDRDDDGDRRPREDRRDSYPPMKTKKKKGWLSEMFEFD
jgi:uncharacterized protein